MIEEKESDISKSEMTAFFNSVPDDYRHSLGLMGGWAVDFLLSGRGRTHIGSRDIDIFFDPRRIDQDSVVKLIEDRGFRPHSTFRWIKFFEWESGKELKENETAGVQQYDLVRIFLDLAAPAKLDHVLYEPLLSTVFDGENEHWEVLGRNILMPNIRVMARIKIKSTPERIDSFKREKDLADLLAMLTTENGLWRIQDGKRIALQDDLRDTRVTILKSAVRQYQVDGTLMNACRQIGMNFNGALQILQTL
jgi:hypothetical protein